MKKKKKKKGEWSSLSQKKNASFLAIFSRLLAIDVVHGLRFQLLDRLPKHCEYLEVPNDTFQVLHTQFLYVTELWHFEAIKYIHKKSENIKWNIQKPRNWFLFYFIYSFFYCEFFQVQTSISRTVVVSSTMAWKLLNCWWHAAL